jgi:hypothetical protein
MHVPKIIFGVLHPFRRAQEHRRMAIVPAGVHAALVARAVLEAVRLVDRQAIHVGAQRHAFAAVFFPADYANHAGLCKAGMRLDS